ncbi:tetratricopeptide repeat protein [Bizionia argentinensis JUB59]|uniref:Tetratricopeptide repeat protein n=1 Tax=Bizionia argentinensis JUB59 TaxID=1046627 RepID=G2EEW1_9FLAO|nr:tetratricopeptide repeat protein [Bizionia argentinensis]EGV43060.1 tetratricopeptide repeat protein [Bizionia argentinensis JUB59]
MKQKIYFILLFFGMIIPPKTTYAQIDYNKINQDDLGDFEDLQQDYFFEALKQKGIENFDRAAEALLKCIDLDKSKSVYHFELGKNYNRLKNFGAAEKALKQAVKMESDNEWYLDELYDVYAQQDDYDKAIKVLKQLVEHHPDYKEDLATLYVKTKDYKNALKVLDEMDDELGLSMTRDIIRNQIYAATGKKKEQIENLEERVEEHPDQETNYLALIYRYSENNEKDKAFETAKKLLEIKPNSQLVHLALYKFYVENNNAEEAIASMKIVIQSAQIKPEAKIMVLTDFVKFVSANPEYEHDLIEATALVTEDKNGTSSFEVAQYYLKKGDKEKALSYYEKALAKDSDNFGITRNMLLLYIDLKAYQKAQSMSAAALNKYPSQPIFYLINGVAFNELNKPQEAIDALEIGLDYIIDDTKMQSDFYKQLSVSYTQLNNTNKAKSFIEKAQQLESSINE